MRFWAKCVVVFLAIAGVGVMILRYGKIHVPVQNGSVEDFWGLVCHVHPQGAADKWDGIGGGLYPIQGDKAVYYLQGIHGQFLYRIGLDELIPSLAPAIEQMQRKRDRGELAPFLCDALDAYQAGGQQADVKRLLECIRRAWSEWIARNAPELSEVQIVDDANFEWRWQRARRYWLTLLFEFIWLAGLIVWLAIPWLRRAGRYGWAVHLGLAPLLLFLPHFLGYATNLYSSLFPDGGAFYPYILAHFEWLPATPLDAWLLQHAPPIFRPFSQSNSWMFDLDCCGTAAIGPVAILGLGLALALGVYVLAAVWRWRAGLVRVKE